MRRTLRSIDLPALATPDALDAPLPRALRNALLATPRAELDARRVTALAARVGVRALVCDGRLWFAADEDAAEALAERGGAEPGFAERVLAGLGLGGDVARASLRRRGGAPAGR